MNVESIIAKFGSTYEDGEPTYNVCNGTVKRLCPCGLDKCTYHVIPTAMQLEGPMEYNGEDLCEKFRWAPVMTRPEARAWWQKYGLVCVTATKIVRTVYVDWSGYNFPVGHEMKGQVKQGTESDRLKERYSAVYPGGVPKYRVSGKTVVQQCQCGKTDCDVHVIPSTVEIDSNVPLELHMKQKVIAFEHTFRGHDCMTCSEVRDWFLAYPLKWDVDVTAKLVKIRMLCKCHKAFDVIPCADCAAKEKRECTECRATFYKRYVKGGLCGNCRRTKIIHCEHCNENVPLAHTCKPLTDMHHAIKLDAVYPPCIRQKGSKDVVCPDCNKCMKYTVYHRHQYRVHSDLRPDAYTRAYKWHTCPYCTYKNCDITNVREHLKTHLHLRQHMCRYGCGASFTRPSAENLHCRMAHDQEVSCVSRLKRVGNELVSVAKKRKICYVS